MPSLKVEQLGQIGYIADKEPVAIPPNAWSEMQNMRCVDRSIASFTGHAQIDTISIQPETINAVKTGVKNFFVYAGGTKIYSYSAGTETDISNTTYGHSSGGTWDSNILGGIAILNNGVENPQYWGGEGTALDLPYDSTGDTTCYWRDVGMTARLIRTFRYHLFAFDIDDCDGRNPRRVWWSHPAEPGTLPITWDITKADYDAGQVELSQTPGFIVDALPLRDTLQIYKDDSVIAATYTGRQDNQIFNFRVVTTSKGLYSRNCVCDVGGRHFFVGDGDIYIYDGTNFNSIADERVKDLFFNGVSRAHRDKTYCVYYHRTGEVWLCYPKASGDATLPAPTACNAALVWDANENTWSQREIPDADCAVFAIVDRVSSYTWGTLPYATWGDWGISPASPAWTQWGQPVDNDAIFDSLVLAGDGELLEMDSGNTAAGTAMSCYCRHTDIDIGDKADWHMVLEVYLMAEGDPFNVRIGMQDNLNAAVTWSDYASFDPDTDYRLNFRVNGRLHAIEFQSEADVSWKVHGFEVDYEPTGRR